MKVSMNGILIKTGKPFFYRGNHLIKSLCKGTCGRRFRRPFPSNRRFYSKIVAYQELFFAVILLAARSAQINDDGNEKISKTKILKV